MLDIQLPVVEQDSIVVASAYSNYSVFNHKNNLNDVRHRMKHVAKFNTCKSRWFTKVVITVHALERWNERVGGKHFETTQELSQYLEMVLSTSVQRYEVVEEPTGCFRSYLIEIDKEIVASVEFENGNIVFCSFFGRISVKPLLSNFNKLKKYLQRQAYENKEFEVDKVELGLSAEELARQRLPVVPITQWVIQTKHKTFTIEKYFVTGQDEPVYAVFQKTTSDPSVDKINRYFINTKQMTFNSKFFIPQIVLNVMKQDGHRKLVTEYERKREIYKQQKELSIVS